MRSVRIIGPHKADSRPRPSTEVLLTNVIKGRTGGDMGEHELVTAAKALVPTLRERARETELLRRVPEETIADLKESGLLRVLQPARYGGIEADLQTYFDVVMALAVADGSVGWVYSVLAGHAHVVAYFPEKAVSEVWGADRDVLIASTALCKEGAIEKVEDGYRIRGLFGFSSGSHHTEWVLVFGVPENAPEEGRRFFLVPNSDYEVIDNWHVIGMCGTGSCDLRIDSEVPPYRSVGAVMGSEVSDSAMYRLPVHLMFSQSLALPLVGTAQGALDDFVDQQRDRVTLLGMRSAADPIVQVTVADAAAQLLAARLCLAANLVDLMEVAKQGAEFSFELIARFDRDRVMAVERALHAVDRVFRYAGGRALSVDNPLQRAWRDIHAGAAHAGNQAPVFLALYGAQAFGMGNPFEL